jgi:hypothetical protein
MSRLRKTIGLCLILAVTLGVFAAVPAYAGGPQGQTKSGQKAPATAPEIDWDYLWWIIVMATML